jgi:hypothetical protein
MITRISGIISATAMAATLSAALAAPAAGQTPVVFSACYVPSVGALYMIKQQGLPQACLSSAHAEVSWRDGSWELADGAVSGAKIADGAISGAKIADGAISGEKIGPAMVSSSHIGDGQVTQTKLAPGVSLPLAPIAGLSVLGRPATEGAPIAIGAGFDGHVLRRSGTAIGFGQVGSAGIADGAITSAKLAAKAFVNSTTFPTATLDDPGTASAGSLSINVPANGMLLLFLTGNAITFGDASELEVWLGTATQTSDLGKSVVGVIDGTGDQRRHFSIGVSAVLNVAPGSRTIHVSIHQPTVFSAHTVRASDMRLTAVFIPN